MKKTFIAFLLLVATLITANAQSLMGKRWYRYLSDRENLALMLSFKEGPDTLADCFAIVAVSAEMKVEDISVIIHFALPVGGSYAIEGKYLIYAFDEDGELNVDLEIIGGDENAKRLVESALKPEIEAYKKEIKPQMLEELPKRATMKIVSLTNDTLILDDEKGNQVTYYIVPD